MSHSLEWWRRYGLTRRPPLTTHPLRPEDAGYFVEVKDDSLRKFLHRVRDPANLYGQIFAVLGDYGSGKTSLLSYVQAAVYSDNILSITIKDPPSSSEKLEDWLYDGIFRRMAGSPKLSTSDYARSLKPSSDSILRLRDVLLTEKKYAGFMIFIDELHHVLDPKDVCDFLKSKQGFFEDLVSQEPVSIFIAGVPQWVEYLKQAAYKGIVDERIQMPYWFRPEDAYELVYRRFKVVAGEDRVKFPFSRFDSFEKILAIRKSESPRGTPRYIIENTLKVLDNPKLPPDCQVITGEMVSQLVSIPRQEDIQEIEKVLANYHGGIYKSLNAIARGPSDERDKLLMIVLVLSQRPRGLNFVTSYRPNKLDHRFDYGKIFKDLPDLLTYLDELEKLKLLRKKEFDPVDLKGSPLDKYVELLRVELRKQPIPVRVYHLRDDFLRFQDKVEQDLEMELQDYLWLLFVSPAAVIQEAPPPQDKIAIMLGEAEKYLKENEAKRRIRLAVKDHSVFMERIRIETQDTRSAIRAMNGFLKSITHAFVIERTKSPDRMLANLSSELEETFRQLELEGDLDLARTLLHEIEISEERGEIDEERWGKLREEYTAIIFHYVEAFRRFAIEGPAVFAVRQLKRTHTEIVQELETVKKNIEKLSPSVRTEETIDFLVEISERLALGAPSGREWATGLVEILQTESADKPLHYSIHSRRYQQTNLRESARKTALLYAGETFENLLKLLGRRHLDPQIRGLFRSASQLNITYMVSKIFPSDNELVEAVNKCGRFNRADVIRSFDNNLGLISLEKRPEVKQFALATLIRNVYAHDSLSWDLRATTSHETFSYIHDSIIAAVIRAYLVLYLNEKFLPPMKFQKIELSDVSGLERKAKVRVDNILWGWVDEQLVKKAWQWLDTAKTWNEFENPASEMKPYDFYRTIAFLREKRLIALEPVRDGWTCQLTELGRNFRATGELQQIPESQVVSAPPPEPQQIDVTPLKLTPTAKRFLATTFGILTCEQLENTLRSSPIRFFKYHSSLRGTVQVFLGSNIVLETVPKSWFRPGDRRLVNGFVVVGVRHVRDLAAPTQGISEYSKPIIVIP